MLKAADLAILVALAAAVVGGAWWVARRSSPAPVRHGTEGASLPPGFMLSQTGSPSLGTAADAGGYMTPPFNPNDGWRVPIAYPGTMD